MPEPKRLPLNVVKNLMISCYNAGFKQANPEGDAPLALVDRDIRYEFCTQRLAAYLEMMKEKGQ